MKKKILLTALLIFVMITMQAQISVSMGRTFRKDTIDQTVFSLQYEVDGCIDTIKQKRFRETMMLEVGKQASKFYSYTKYVADSVFAADVANRASQETINAHATQYGQSRLNEQTYKRYPIGKVTTLNEIAGDINRLRCEEIEEQPKWTLSEDTLTILSYSCRKAECRFKGRKWTAWFTTEIPSSEGPWKLGGLPGLILKAADSQGHYNFTCTGIEQCHSYRPLFFNGKDYEPVNRKAYNKIHERYYADPVGFITGSNPSVRISMKDEHGNKAANPKKLPYNPIERD
ncbi:MAG: GLPGLI family protein [Bacteroides sp.]